MADDAPAARAEYYCEWRDDVSNYVDRASVEAVVGDYEELPPSRGHVAFLDCAGGSGKDSMALAVGHYETGVAVVDALHWRDPPFSPRVVVGEFSEVLRRYGVRMVTADGWGSGFTAEAFRQHGITLEQRARPKAEIYVEQLSAINSRSIRLPNIAKMVNQICSLERRSRVGGRDLIDAPRNQHEDLANVALGVCSLAAKPVYQPPRPISVPFEWK